VTSIEGAAALAPEPSDDEAAVARLKALHDAEFHEFTEATYHTVERILQAKCRERDVVQDALHEAYLYGRVHWHKIRDYTEPIAWVIKTARNKILNERDRIRREAAMAPEDLPPKPQPEPTDAWEAQDILRGWLQQLPPRPAQVFQMSREGFSNQEIALVLGLAEISVRSYKAAARKQLRQLAETAGYKDSDSRRRRGGARGSR
jgi:RNA polymerase sigma-70 factor (ECF subfamily)